MDKFFIVLFLMFCSQNCMSLSKQAFYFGFEGNSIKNYFEIDLLPINLINYNTSYLKEFYNPSCHNDIDYRTYMTIVNKANLPDFYNRFDYYTNPNYYNTSNYYNDPKYKKILLRKKMLHVTKHFFNYLQDIKTDDFVYINGLSAFIGYQVNEYLSINFGKTYGSSCVDVKINKFNEFFKNKLINKCIGQYRYNYESTWLDLFKFFSIEKKLFLLFSFGIEFAKSKFTFFSNDGYENYNPEFIKKNKFNLKNVDKYNISNNENGIIKKYNVNFKNVNKYNILNNENNIKKKNNLNLKNVHRPNISNNKNSVIKKNNFNLKNANKYNISNNKKSIKKKYIPYTFKYKKNNEINIVKEVSDFSYSKICRNHLLGINFSSNRKGVRFGFGIKGMISSCLYVNLLFRNHFFISDYKHINFLSGKLLSTSIGIVYKF